MAVYDKEQEESPAESITPPSDEVRRAEAGEEERGGPESHPDVLERHFNSSGGSPGGPETAGNQPSSPTFGPEQLKKDELAAVGQPSAGNASQTAPGKINFSNRPKSSNGGATSTGTSHGKVGYNPEVPEHEQKFYNSSATAPGRVRFGNFLNNPRRRLMAGGGIAVIIAGGSVIIFMSLIPLKILHIVNNLESRFTASAQSAMQRETDSLISDYFKRVILPAHRQCGAIIDKSCNPITGTDPISRLYRGWRNAHLEDQFAQKYGLEFGYNKYSGQYYMKAPGLAKELNLNDFVNGADSNMTLDEWLSTKAPGLEPVTRNEIRLAVRDATANETLWRRTFIRYKMRGFLLEKYGIPKCIFFCEGRDKLSGFITDQKNAAKLAINRLVLMPYDQSLGVVMECLLSGCDPTTDKTPTTPCQEGVDCALNGEAENASVDTKVRLSLDELAAQYGVEGGPELKALYDQVVKDGVTQTSVERVLARLMGQDAASASAKTTVEALSVVGWLLLADQIANLVNAANNSPATIKKLDYVVNAAAAVNLYAVYRVYADEIKTGQANATEVGSLVDSLGPVAANAHLDNLKGGTAGAEQSPLYNYLINNGSPEPSSTYKCDDGSTPAATSVTNSTCPEETLGGVDNSLLDGLHSALNSPPLLVITQAASFWKAFTTHTPVSFVINTTNGVLNSLIGTATSLLNKLGCVQVAGINIIDFGGYCELKSAIQKGTKYIGEAMVKYLVPNPFSNNMSGGRTFTMMAAGADVSGNDYAHSGLGGQELTPQQTADNLNQQDLEAWQNYQKQPLLSRLFSTDSTYSPITRLAMAMPDSLSQVGSSLADFFIHPFSRLSGAVGTIFHPSYAIAAATAQSDPFGVVQYGYPAGTIPTDQQTYWQQNCSDNPTNAYQKDNSWNQAAANNLDPNTEMPVNNTVNPCLLIQAGVDANGAVFDPSLATEGQ